MVSILNKTRINYKIKVDNGKEVDHVLINARIKPLLGCRLTMLEEFKSKQGVYMKVFKGKWLIGKFFLSPIVEIVGFLAIKKKNHHIRNESCLSCCEKLISTFIYF